MPKFTTISPTSISGKKEYAWNKFLTGKYISIGWLPECDLTGKAIDEIVTEIRKQKYSNDRWAIDAFRKFLALNEGDYVAVNNTADGLFGIGVIKSSYKYQRYKHDTGSDDKEDFYSHYRVVE